MLEMERFLPHGFQQATIRWVTDQIIKKKGRKVKRFLVADEVGLGKTIIAKNVIDEIRNNKKTSTPLRIIYITSNLDIAQQNCHKLANDDEVIKADRISLAFRESLLGKDDRPLYTLPKSSENHCIRLHCL